MYPRIHPNHLPNAKHLKCFGQLRARGGDDRAPRADRD